MSDPLKGLKQAMNKTVFHKINFSDKQKESIEKELLHLILRQEDIEKNIEILIFKSLVDNSRPGYDIFKYLQRESNIFALEEHEGKLYVFLHRLEQNQLISSRWVENQERLTKVYQLEKKGKRLLEACSSEGSKEVERGVKIEWEGGLI